ncbi:hypothetical protein [Candidatus Uabimicrobium sp. HlEnr_7]|uniref:hypothetical protein n=1 Tax=Candidatus Uabimicrobium helgolandensis TaxID=3095367 RepID=UPI003557104E
MDNVDNPSEEIEEFPHLPDNLKRNLYDPLETAKAEGEAYGAAISGKYRAKFIIRITFLIGGFGFFISGAYSAYNIIEEIKLSMNADFLIMSAYLVFMLAMTIGGLMAMIKAIKNGRKKESSFDNNESTMWTCDNCKEQVEDQYSACWKCLQQRK